jgi:hypothetical protein
MAMGIGSRPRIAAAAAALAIAVAGCGGDDEPTSAEAARAAADDFVAALEGGDFEAACKLLTPQLAEQLGGEACPDQIAQVAGESGEVSITITNVRTSGPKAVADTEVRRQGEPAQESSLDLVEHEGDWQVSAVGD